MSKLLQDSTFFCLAISLIGYELGILLRQKTKLALCNPLLISIIFVIIILKVTNIQYEVYEDGSQVLSYLLTPSTVCLAIPLYQQMDLLKKNMKATSAGISPEYSQVLPVCGYSVCCSIWIRRSTQHCFQNPSQQPSEWVSPKNLAVS